MHFVKTRFFSRKKSFIMKTLLGKKSYCINKRQFRFLIALVLPVALTFSVMRLGPFGIEIR